ncbi:RNA 2',3'-cyclic phosphodiesterase [Methanonatronarchaeum sp. AMET-Sl]|uniref:RNA 2',3'-cyclic phosphodiesterase n=1 Tax=Methanonatronarchaeum sp. AMET-Sl TaxID=3037654 RepID=UPI00244DF2E6|nr:RNA 2',3'-cyclic phosphodiesterase [Methanonatronarchaeum sp. AMET-Sl]WGI17806.1 RNA 2',3'-cyclic phosphodiesterase [Methanonatronarchaeum sp. AMET-Sl]
MRSFISLDLPDEFSDEIERIQNELVASGADLNLVDPEKVHITLKFLGEIDSNQLENVFNGVKKAIGGFDSFKASIETVGVFPDLDYIKVIWLGVDKGSQEVVNLHQRIEQEMVSIGFDEEEHEFVPHATLARVKSGRNKEQLVETLKKNEGIYVGETTFNSVKIKKSELKPEGPVYTDLKEVKLGG